MNIHWKDWCWNSSTLATWWEEPTQWKRLWCLERLRAGGEGGDRGWDGWMASLIQWTWVWANSGRWWRTGKPGVLQFMRSQRVGHDWMTERQQSGQGRMRWGDSRARGEDRQWGVGGLENLPGVAPGRQEQGTWGTWPQSFWYSRKTKTVRDYMKAYAFSILAVYISTLEIPNGSDLVGQVVSIIGDLSCQLGDSLFLEISKADGPSLPPDPLGMYRCGFPGHREPREEWAAKGSATTSVCLSTLPLGTNHLCVSIPSPQNLRKFFIPPKPVLTIKWSNMKKALMHDVNKDEALHLFLFPITIQHHLIMLASVRRCLPLNYPTGLQVFQGKRFCLFYSQVTSIYPTALHAVGTQYMQILIIMMLSTLRLCVPPQNA